MTALPAGRELDALVAEKVMGERRLSRNVDVGDGREFRWKIHGELLENPPAYSTDIAAAWEVVEKLGKRFNVFVDYPTSGNVHANTGIMCDDFGHGHTCADAATAPHAICLAALKAVGAPADKWEG